MPKTPDYFAGKTIMITGAASGIGRATALIFARERANVVCADLNEEGARETAATIKRHRQPGAGVAGRRHVAHAGERHGPARDRQFRQRRFSFQLGRRRDPPRQVLSRSTTR